MTTPVPLEASRNASLYAHPDLRPESTRAPRLNVYLWFDEPACRAAQGTFAERGTFILAKLQEHAAAKLKDCLDDIYRDAVPNPQDITKFEWQTILGFMGASEEEIKDVQKRMGGCGGDPSPCAVLR